MHKTAIIVAGGSGTRMEMPVLKQFIILAGKPVLMWTLEKFYAYDPVMHMILVLPSDKIKDWQILCKDYHFELPHEIVKGGATRFHSVVNGFQKAEKDSLIAIHDGVRPAVSLDTIHRCYNLAAQKGNGIPAIQPSESVRMIDKAMSRILDRTKIRIIQTPQVFKYKQLNRAFKQDFRKSFTDDASVVEAAGYNIHLTRGNRENIKITTPLDLSIAEIHILDEGKFNSNNLH